MQATKVEVHSARKRNRFRSTGWTTIESRKPETRLTMNVVIMDGRALFERILLGKVQNPLLQLFTRTIFAQSKSGGRDPLVFVSELRTGAGIPSFGDFRRERNQQAKPRHPVPERPSNCFLYQERLPTPLFARRVNLRF